MTENSKEAAKGDDILKRMLKTPPDPKPTPKPKPGNGEGDGAKRDPT